MSMTHPFDPESRYELLDDGTIKLTRGKGLGIFTAEGVYLSGDIRESDPQICNWVSNVPDPSSQLATSRIAGRDDGGGGFL